jgi:hypothetical protein
MRGSIVFPRFACQDPEESRPFSLMPLRTSVTRAGLTQRNSETDRSLSLKNANRMRLMRSR